ncbi:hypothetical protein ACFVHW_04410 [Streptomyces sp. NPDC127110]|uniref:hypothetical protein n=1 Tax=Streptomyces sp. NPDC127110 TaxID=3345362 RepID=UPI0036407B0E
MDEESTLTLTLSHPSGPRPVPGLLPTGVVATHSSRFLVPAADASARRAQMVVGSLLRLVVGADEGADRTVRDVGFCLAELVAAATRSVPGGDLLCEVRVDGEHVHFSVEYSDPLPARARERATGLDRLDGYIDGCGMHADAGTRQVWASVRRS